MGTRMSCAHVPEAVCDLTCAVVSFASPASNPGAMVFWRVLCIFPALSVAMPKKKMTDTVSLAGVLADLIRFQYSWKFKKIVEDPKENQKDPKRIKRKPTETKK